MSWKKCSSIWRSYLDLHCQFLYITFSKIKTYKRKNIVGCVKNPQPLLK